MQEPDHDNEAPRFYDNYELGLPHRMHWSEKLIFLIAVGCIFILVGMFVLRLLR